MKSLKKNTILKGVTVMRSVVSLFAAALALPTCLGASSGSGLREQMVEALDLYGSVSRYEARGVITIIRRGPDVYVQGGRVPGPPVIRNREFHFQFERGRSVRLRLYQMVDKDKAPFKVEPTHEVLTQPSGTYSYVANGKLVRESESLREIALSCSSEDKWLFGFLVDVLHPENHYKFLESRLRGSGKRTIGKYKTQGIHLASTSRKRIWIEPTSDTIARVLYLQNKQSLKGEIAQLEAKLERLGDNELARGNNIALEIDALADPHGFNPTFIYELSTQTFD